MIVDKGSDPKYGARPIRRAIETLLEDPIAEAMLRGELTAGHSSEVMRRDTESSAISFAADAPQKLPATKSGKRAPRKTTAKKTPSEKSTETPAKRKPRRNASSPSRGEHAE